MCKVKSKWAFINWNNYIVLHSVRVIWVSDSVHFSSVASWLDPVTYIGVAYVNFSPSIAKNLDLQVGSTMHMTAN